MENGTTVQEQYTIEAPYTELVEQTYNVRVPYFLDHFFGNDEIVPPSLYVPFDVTERDIGELPQIQSSSGDIIVPLEAVPAPVADPQPSTANPPTPEDASLQYRSIRINKNAASWHDGDVLTPV